MKTILPKIIFLLLLGILSCKKNDSDKAIQKAKTENVPKPYFDYDKIEYFHSNVNNNLEGLSEIYDKLEKGKIDSLEFKVLVGNVPENLNDSLFVNKLNKIGFQQILLSEEQQNKLREIFVNNNRESEPKDAIKPIFTDILVFKKENRIVGFSKLSTKYLQSRIIGSNYNSDYFPTNIEHKKIEKILVGK